MTKLIIIICLNIAHFVCQAQTNGSVDYMTTFKKADWKTNKGWFGDSIVALTPIDKLPNVDTTGHTKHEIDSLIVVYVMARHDTWGERIHFDVNGKLEYTYSISCPVGEILYDLRAYNISGDTVTVEYSVYKWNEKNIEYKKAYYLINKCTLDEIILKRTIE